MQLALDLGITEAIAEYQYLSLEALRIRNDMSAFIPR